MGRLAIALVLLATACREPQAVATGDRTPTLSSAQTQVMGVIPAGSDGIVLSDDGIPCVGDVAYSQVVCASGGDWAAATRTGREGRGPNEFRTVWKLVAGENGSVVVSDIQNSRVTWIDPADGRILRTHRAPQYFRPSGPERDGHVEGARHVSSGRTMSERLSAPLTLALVSVNSATGEADSEIVLTVPDKERPVGTTLVSTGWRLPDGRIGAILSDGRIGYWSVDGEYLSTVVSPEYSPRTFNKKESVALWEGSSRGPFGSPGDSARRVQEYMEMPAPAYRGDARRGPRDTVWFLTWGDGVSEGSVFEVFHGLEYVGRVRVQDTAREFDIRDSTLVVVRDSGTKDEFGSEQEDVALYDISFPDDAR